MYVQRNIPKKINELFSSNFHNLRLIIGRKKSISDSRVRVRKKKIVKKFLQRYLATLVSVAVNISTIDRHHSNL